MKFLISDHCDSFWMCVGTDFLCTFKYTVGSFCWLIFFWPLSFYFILHNIWPIMIAFLFLIAKIKFLFCYIPSPEVSFISVSLALILTSCFKQKYFIKNTGRQIFLLCSLLLNWRFFVLIFFNKVTRVAEGDASDLHDFNLQYYFVSDGKITELIIMKMHFFLFFLPIFALYQFYVTNNFTELEFWKIRKLILPTVFWSSERSFYQFLKQIADKVFQ